MSLESTFKATAEKIRNSKPVPGKEKSNEEKLKIYGLYKQATEGDVKGEQPYMIQFEARSKWDAWNGFKGMDKGKRHLSLLSKNTYATAALILLVATPLCIVFFYVTYKKLR